RVECIFDEFFSGGSGALNDFTGRNFVGEGFRHHVDDAVRIDGYFRHAHLILLFREYLRSLFGRPHTPRPGVNAAPRRRIKKGSGGSPERVHWESSASWFYSGCAICALNPRLFWGRSNEAHS